MFTALTMSALCYFNCGLLGELLLHFSLSQIVYFTSSTFAYHRNPVYRLRTYTVHGVGWGGIHGVGRLCYV